MLHFYYPCSLSSYLPAGRLLRKTEPTFLGEVAGTTGSNEDFILGTVVVCFDLLGGSFSSRACSGFNCLFPQRLSGWQLLKVFKGKCVATAA